MNRLAFISLILLLSACASAQGIMPTGTPVASDTTPSKTTTPGPTEILPTPTEKPDPNAPKDGYDTKEKKNGEWIYYKEINGETFTWNKELQGFFISHILPSPDNINGGIPLSDKTIYGDSAFSPMYLNVHSDVLNIPSIRHTTNPDNWGKSLSGAVFNGLHNHRFKSLSQTDYYTTRSKGFSVPFETPLGEKYKWMTNKGYEVNVISWEDADPALHSEFFETPSRKGRGTNVTRWTVFTKKDGTLVAKMAFKDPASMTDVEFLEGLLNPMGTVIEFEKLPTQKQLAQGWWFHGYPGDYVLGASTQPSRPFFDIQKNP